MTDSRFEELVSLYLDQEISEQDVRKLRSALQNSEEFRIRFDEKCRLYFAEKVVFQPDAKKQVAREIATLRGLILEGLKPTRSGRGRYLVRQWSPGAFAALAAAIVALIAFGHNVLNGPLGQSEFSKGLASMHTYMADQGQQARKTLVRSQVGAPLRTLAEYQPQAPLSTTLHLSGLSNAGSANLALAELETPWQSILEDAQESAPRKRLVLIVPKNALPERSMTAPVHYTFPTESPTRSALSDSGGWTLQTNASY